MRGEQIYILCTRCIRFGISCGFMCYFLWSRCQRTYFANICTIAVLLCSCYSEINTFLGPAQVGSSWEAMCGLENVAWQCCKSASSQIKICMYSMYKMKYSNRFMSIWEILPLSFHNICYFWEMATYSIQCLEAN